MQTTEVRKGMVLSSKYHSRRSRSYRVQDILKITGTSGRDFWVFVGVAVKAKDGSSYGWTKNFAQGTVGEELKLVTWNQEHPGNWDLE